MTSTNLIRSNTQRLTYLWLAFFSIWLSAQEAFTTVSGPEQESYLRSLQSNLQQNVTLACQFDQEKHLEIFDDVMNLRGWCCIARPSQIRWEYTAPLQKWIVLQGDNIAVYKAGASPKSPNSQETQYLKTVYGYIVAFLSGNFLVSKETFRLHVQKSPGGQHRLVFQAQGKLSQFLQKIVLTVALDNSRIATVLIREPKGDFTSIRFHDYQANPQLPPDLFSGKAFPNFRSLFGRDK